MLFRSNDNASLLSKSITLGQDGQPVADGSACHMKRGQARNIKVDGAQGFANIINGMKPCRALALGTIETEKVQAKFDDKVQVVTARSLPEDPNGVIARTKDFINFQCGQPGFMLIDLDYMDVGVNLIGLFLIMVVIMRIRAMNKLI